MEEMVMKWCSRDGVVEGVMVVVIAGVKDRQVMEGGREHNFTPG